jgi:hypothetical protein
MPESKMTEQRIYELLKRDFDTKDPDKRTRFTEKQIAKALGLPSVKKALRSLLMKNGHIHQYNSDWDGKKGKFYRYRSKTMQHQQETLDLMTKAYFGG